MLEPLTAHVTWIVLLAHSWSLHGLNKIVNRFLASHRQVDVDGAQEPECTRATCRFRAPAAPNRRRRSRCVGCSSRNAPGPTPLAALQSRAARDRVSVR
ncbi:hypothetical protein BRN47_12650 [Xanthomonas oryzae pv. oryzae]|nr:hypothetical protein EBA26_24845 [Xanthomonas oryzae pv. oryzae]RBB94215.1 hypothetical protein BRN47_12650 [Xanthomonas oryzae pv. oryzae]RBC20550.1 hypothetical protein BRN37_19050 [Xanthomonas oryzae pv. oryzae]RBC20982.1 hypothetical protein BRN26_16855 [Xanthomonas oryzae pv. oryzae]RBC24444.1 hypothetical protein BRN28_15940 [Xanthomonas oryzae pv. oryzae]